jgi:hypothetical protein
VGERVIYKPSKNNENEFRGWHGMLPVGSTYGYLLTGACIEWTFNGQYLFVDTRILTPNSREHHPFPSIHHTSTMAFATISSHINGLNHGDSVVLPTPTISLSTTNAVEAVACLLHSVGKSETTTII